MLLMNNKCFQVFDICKNSEDDNSKAIAFAGKLGVKLTTEEKDLRGKFLLKVSEFSFCICESNEINAIFCYSSHIRYVYKEVPNEGN
jgi:hypothetical protein